MTNNIRNTEINSSPQPLVDCGRIQTNPEKWMATYWTHTSEPLQNGEASYQADAFAVGTTRAEALAVLEQELSEKASAVCNNSKLNRPQLAGMGTVAEYKNADSRKKTKLNINGLASLKTARASAKKIPTPHEKDLMEQFV